MQRLSQGSLHNAASRRMLVAPSPAPAALRRGFFPAAKQQLTATRSAVASSSGSSRRRLQVSARYYRSAAPSVGDRVLAALPFLLPFLDAFSYGRFLFYQFPMIARAVAPMAPLLSLYHSVPFAALICFFGIYIGIVNNMQVSRFVRFSAMQAVLLDILLVLPRLLEQLVSPPTSAGVALQAYISAQNAIWISVAACVAFGIVSALLGREGRIPFIADAAEAQVR